MYSNCKLYDYQIEVLGKYMFWTLKLNKIDGYLRSAISSVFFILANFTSTCTMYLFFCSNNEILLTLSF